MYGVTDFLNDQFYNKSPSARPTGLKSGAIGYRICQSHRIKIRRYQIGQAYGFFVFLFFMRF